MTKSQLFVYEIYLRAKNVEKFQIQGISFANNELKLHVLQIISPRSVAHTVVI
jgi:hypothetical protein